MNVQIQSVKFDADKKLIEFTEKKISKLSKFLDNIVNVSVIFSLSSSNDPNNKVTKIKVEVPGQDLFTEHQSNSFEKGIDLGIDALKIQIEKYKDKR